MKRRDRERSTHLSWGLRAEGIDLSGTSSICRASLATWSVHRVEHVLNFICRTKPVRLQCTLTRVILSSAWSGCLGHVDLGQSRSAWDPLSVLVPPRWWRFCDWFFLLIGESYLLLLFIILFIYFAKKKRDRMVLFTPPPPSAVVAISETTEEW